MNLAGNEEESEDEDDSEAGSWPSVEIFNNSQLFIMFASGPKAAIFRTSRFWGVRKSYVYIESNFYFSGSFVAVQPADICPRTGTFPGGTVARSQN